MDKQEATRIISELIKLAESCLEEARRLAAKAEIEHPLYFNGPDNGMGGWVDDRGWHADCADC